MAAQMHLWVAGTAHQWNDQEQAALEAGLLRYPSNVYSNVTRYVKIAAALPTKSVRDVAHRVKWMADQGRVVRPISESGAISRTSVPTSAKGVAGAGHGARGGDAKSKVVDPEQETHVNAVLQENVLIINRMRDNLLNGSLNDNVELMMRFRTNITAVLNWLTTLPPQMPQMPVQINCALMPGLATNTNIELPTTF